MNEFEEGVAFFGGDIISDTNVMNDLKYDEEKQYHYNDDYVFFTKSFLSQWYGAFNGQTSEFTIRVFGKVVVTFNCAEQAMMWSKAMLFGDYEIANEIINESHPKKQKDLGRQASGFKQDVWDNVKFDLIRSINHSKFLENQTLWNLLAGTGNRTLVEAAPWDKVWGIGMGVDDPDILDESKWTGENLLGEALMDVRLKLCNIEHGIIQ